MTIETGKRQVLVDAVLNFGSIAQDASAALTVAVPQVQLGQAVIVTAPRNVAAVASQGTLTMDTNPTADDTMTIGTTVYTYKSTFTGAANEILIGGGLAATQANTVKAINGTGTPGTEYGMGTVAHPDVTMADFATNAAVITAIVPGTAGDSIATTETFTAGTNVFDAATLGTTRAGAAVSGLTATAHVSAADEVTVILTNGTAAAVDADEGTFRVIVWF